MQSRISTTAAAAPAVDTPAHGVLRALAARSAATGLEARVPAAAADGLRAWLAAELEGAGEARGLSVEGLAVGAVGKEAGEWLDALGWVGVPLARSGALTWGRDLRHEAGAERPSESAPTGADRVLLLPGPARLRALGSLELKPVRAFIAARLGCRLQTASGVQVFLWDDRALLVSCAEVPVAGFFHGPVAGQRATIAIDPGGFQALRW